TAGSGAVTTTVNDAIEVRRATWVGWYQSSPERPAPRSRCRPGTAGGGRSWSEGDGGGRPVRAGRVPGHRDEVGAPHEGAEDGALQRAAGAEETLDGEAPVDGVPGGRLDGEPGQVLVGGGGDAHGAEGSGLRTPPQERVAGQAGRAFDGDGPGVADHPPGEGGGLLDADPVAGDADLDPVGGRRPLQRDGVELPPGVAAAVLTGDAAVTEVLGGPGGHGGGQRRW